MALKRSSVELLQQLKKARSGGGGGQAPPKPRFTQHLRYNVLQDDVEKSKSLRSNRVCFASSFAEHARAKRLIYLHKLFSLAKKSG